MSRTVDARRLRAPATVVALALSFLGAVGETLGTVVAGRLAAGPSGVLLALLAACLVGGAALDSVGRVLWAGVADRAEGRLRDDLLDAALHQPLATLSEQAVGEVLDRVDDDTHDVGTLVRRQVWEALRTVFAALPMWVVAGLTWWPAWFLFPLVGTLAVLSVRPLLADLTRRKVEEEVAWTDHAAAFEEGVAARDDLRTSLGQAHVLRRTSELAARVHRTMAAVVASQAAIALRTGCCCTPCWPARRSPASRSSSTTPSRSVGSSRSSSSRPPSSARSTRWRATSPTCRPASVRSCGCDSCWVRSGSRRAAPRCPPRRTSSCAT
ncbi:MULTISPECIES: ABC transporter transmembrane domain-containing protein [unclassified Nocardioides]|uniref:ABC transporter transmembrane domain-containing protein n=1 Tax=unclassified Nocardioides TaxID=2615069 RepID=UPI002406A61F|nr:MULTISPECIES: ABC transporter transmembrane domain-containing protein [unclassified Nocardioides]